MNWHFGFGGEFSFALENVAVVQKLNVEVPGGPTDHRTFPVSACITFRQPVDFFLPNAPIILSNGKGAIRPISWHGASAGARGSLVSVILIEGLAAELFLSWWRQKSDTYFV